MIKLDNKFTVQFSPNEQLVMLRLLLGADEDGIARRPNTKLGNADIYKQSKLYEYNRFYRE